MDHLVVLPLQHYANHLVVFSKTLILKGNPNTSLPVSNGTYRGTFTLTYVPSGESSVFTYCYVPSPV